MPFSSIPILFVGQLAFWVWAARILSRAGHYQSRHRVSLGVAGALLVVWSVETSVLAAEGHWISEATLPWMPALWIPFLPVSIIAGATVAMPGFREALVIGVRELPWQSFAWLQALRTASIGTVAKMSVGEFPMYFGLLVGIPDLLYGLSAIAIARSASKGTLTQRGFVTWNLAGALLIVPFGSVLIQMGLPGPWETFTGEPRIDSIFEFPMAMAPTLVVPLFVGMNLLVVGTLKTRGAAPSSI